MTDRQQLKAPPPRPAPRALLAWFATSLATFGCGPREQAPPVFGGEGATIEARQTPLSEAPEDDVSGPCGKAAPTNDNPLLEDFEDGDNHLFKVFHRDGWWFSASDTTDGTLFPEGKMAASELPETERSPDNRMALHGKAEGFSDWGAVWGTTLRWVEEGVKCPYNASNFQGFAFRARGSGVLRVKVGNPATIPTHQEQGSCKQRCWDLHSKTIHLVDTWQTYVVRFNRIQQGGWGTEALFDPSRLVLINFSADDDSMPVDFWVDDMRFFDAETDPSNQATPEQAIPEQATPEQAPPEQATLNAAPLTAAPQAPASVPAPPAKK